MSFSTRELEEAMTNQYGSYWSDLKWAIDRYGEVLFINGEDYKVEYVAADFGDYDTSSSLWVVFKVGDEHYRKTGYYASHYGSEWDGSIEKVGPKEVTRIEWETI